MFPAQCSIIKSDTTGVKWVLSAPQGSRRVPKGHRPGSITWGARKSLPSEWESSLHTLSRSAFPWMYLLYSLILRAQLRSGCLTVFFSRRRALANQLDTCADAPTSSTPRSKREQVKPRCPGRRVQVLTYLDKRHV